MSDTLRLLGGTTLALFVAARVGVFGNCKIKIKKDDEHESIHWSPLWHVAYWNPGDCYARVYHRSIRPIEFVYTDDYSLWGPHVDQTGNKS
jgi:hypothetical protein